MVNWLLPDIQDLIPELEKNNIILGSSITFQLNYIYMYGTADIIINYPANLPKVLILTSTDYIVC